jgi:dihydroorotase
MKCLAVVVAALLVSNAAWAPFDSLALAQGTQVQYDLLLKGGHVIDPRNDINRRMDVAVTAGKIARVAETIPAGEARRVVDVSGLYVTPGLVDIHVHVYNGADVLAEYSGDRSVPPDGFTFRSGVTTVVDLGSSGWRSFPDFKTRVIDRSRTRVLAMLNIVGRGMAGGSTIEQNTQDMQPEETARVARQYPDIIVGVKTAHFEGPEWTAVDRAVAAGTAANIPVAVDFGNFNPGRPFEELVTKHLRPGDWYTHMYTQRVPYFDANGKLRPYLHEARKRGVKFDVGHGGGSFSWSNAIPAIAQGFVPDSISTDLHVGSMNAGMKDMTNVMSKILNQNVPLADVIRMSTVNPATQIKRPELGNLSVGSGADVAVLRVDEGKFGFLDARGARADGTKLIVCELTLRNGAVAWDLNGRAGEHWKTFYATKPSNTPPRP